MVEGETTVNIDLEVTDDVPVLIETASVVPAVPPKRMTLDEINDPRRVPIPSHWLKGPPEPWRPYLHWFL
jgi:hypothetical protein